MLRLPRRRCLKVVYVREPEHKLVSGNRGAMEKLRVWRRNARFEGQDGFIRAALHSQFQVRELTLPEFKKRAPYLDFDCLFLNIKSDPKRKRIKPADIQFIRQLDKPKILIDTRAQSENLSELDMLNQFDLVYKREPFIDRDKYGLPSSVADRIHPTMLAIPRLQYVKKRIRSINNFRLSSSPPLAGQDVFFSGSGTSVERWRALKSFDGCNLATDFTLVPKVKDTGPEFGEDFISPKLLPIDEYMGRLISAKISLVIPGYGAFTYRHLESFAVGSCVVTSPQIKEIELIIPFTEGRHFVCYAKPEKALEACEEVVSDSEARESIASTARSLFWQYYNPEKHGRDILRSIEKL